MVASEALSAETQARVDAERIATFRSGFDLTRGVHLNNAGVAPMCQPAGAAISNLAQQMVHGGMLGMNETLADYQATREAFAWLTGARPDHVSHMQTCAVALTQMAFGIPLRKGDQIVRWDQEYPSNAYPWYAAAKASGAEVVVVPSGDDFKLDTGRMLDAINAQTKVVTVSWVQFSTGAMTDLAALSARCREVDAWLVVDAIQGLGIIPFDMNALGVDAVCGGTHKWLAGPIGHGFLALAEGRRDLVRPLLHGAITYGTPDDAVDEHRAPRSDPQRFEPGTPLMLGAAGGAAAIAHLRAAGIETLSGAALDLSDRLIAGVRARGGKILSATEGRPRSPIVTFIPRQGVAPVLEKLSQQDFAVASRAGGIRVAPHAFNTRDEVDALLCVLDETAVDEVS